MWFKKLVEYCIENSKKCDAYFNEFDCKQICVDIEHDVFQHAKNLIIYQSHIMKKIKEIKDFSKDDKSYMVDYNSKQDKSSQEKCAENYQSSTDESLKPLGFTSGFTSAASLMRNEKTEKIQQKLFEDQFFNLNPARSFDLDTRGEIIMLDSTKLDLNESNSVVMIEDDSEPESAANHVGGLNESNSVVMIEDDDAYKDPPEKPCFKTKTSQEPIVMKCSPKPKNKCLTLQVVSRIVVSQLTVHYKNNRFADKVTANITRFVCENYIQFLF